MQKLTLTSFMLLLLLLLGISSRNYATQSKQKTSDAPTGTLQKMIAQNGSVTMDLDLNRLNGNGLTTENVETLQFAVAANSFFSILVFNDLLRGPEPGSMALISQSQNLSGFPSGLSASIDRLLVEKLPSGEAFDLAVREAKTGFMFFNIEGAQYEYDANAHLLTITGRLLVSQEFAKSLGRPSDANAVGQISIGATMQPIEVIQLDAKGDVKAATLPALNQPRVGTVPGPDVIIGDLIGLQQLGTGAVNGRVGVSLGTDACNKGTIDVNWFSLPNSDHPFIPQNLYRRSGGVDNTQRFEQIGQSWGKHAFTAASSNTCGFGCNGVGGSRLGSGCSDAYGAGLNGSQTGIGSRAWINPFTGIFNGSIANNHSGHTHDVTSHRMLIDVNDLNTSLNVGATYFAEAEYIVPHEYSWCQSHPGECNMYNNASYRQYNVTGINQPFSFSNGAPTVREQPAIMAWTGATVNQVQPDPGNDGIWFIGYKITNPTTGVWHYEYALYNQNLDRAIQSFSVPLGPGVTISNVGFHAPIQHPPWANDGTFNSLGYSSTPWTVNQNASSITWSTETLAQNQNANAIRYGTLYNFRFDADQAPNPTDATVGFFKTGAPIPVVTQAPGNVPPPTPTPTPTPTPPPTPTPTPTPTPCGQYTITPGTNTIVAGTTDTGNHCDDCVTTVALPFSFQLYNQTYNSANVSSNGRLGFVSSDASFQTTCLPASDNTIFGGWQDLRTDGGLSGCSGYPGGACGIFTSVSGTAPNRIFNIEWRAVLFGNNASSNNFEVRLYENHPQDKRFDVIYGALNTAGAGNSYVAGVQGVSPFVTQDFCGATPPQNVSRTYTAACAPMAQSAVSRKAHGAIGNFDLPLPLTGANGVECRTGGGATFDSHTVIVTFATNVTVGGVTVSSPDGGSAAATQSVAGAVVTVSMTGVTDQHNYVVTLTNLNDGTGTGNVTIPIGILRGDTNGDRTVNAGDALQTRNRSGQTADGTNFRSDVNTDGTVNSGDILTVRNASGGFLP